MLQHRIDKMNGSIRDQRLRVKVSVFPCPRRTGRRTEGEQRRSRG
ncbi:unnamed protein product, partial [Musa acuminata subsp. burmannicoides]